MMTIKMENLVLKNLWLSKMVIYLFILLFVFLFVCFFYPVKIVLFIVASTFSFQLFAGDILNKTNFQFEYSCHYDILVFICKLKDSVNPIKVMKKIHKGIVKINLFFACLIILD